MTEATGRLLQEHEPAEEATDQELAAEVPVPAAAAGPEPAAEVPAPAAAADPDQELAADVPVPEPVAAQDPEPAADVPAPAAAAGPDQAPAPALATPVPAPPRRPRRARRAEVAEPVAGPATVAISGRPNALRLARLHLRMGQLLLARAQLEALAGRGDLDEAALLDLAEARWRTGDLAGAGEAAGALLAHGGEDGLALLIAAESVAALGRPGEARRMAARALAVTVGPLDPIFGGMPRNPIWPDDKVAAGEDPAAPEDGGAAGHPDHLGHVVRPRHAAPGGDPEGPASAAAAEAFAGGRAALAGGDIGQAALRLGVAMRLDAGFAEGVLEAVGAWDRDPALALVAGDALRLLGREAEAQAAFDRARGRP